jgi:hypothetical protein
MGLFETTRFEIWFWEISHEKGKMGNFEGAGVIIPNILVNHTK